MARHGAERQNRVVGQRRCPTRHALDGGVDCSQHAESIGQLVDDIRHEADHDGVPHELALAPDPGSVADDGLHLDAPLHGRLAERLQEDVLQRERVLVLVLHDQHVLCTLELGLCRVHGVHGAALGFVDDVDVLLDVVHAAQVVGGVARRRQLPQRRLLPRGVVALVPRRGHVLAPADFGGRRAAPCHAAHEGSERKRREGPAVLVRVQRRCGEQQQRGPLVIVLVRVRHLVDRYLAPAQKVAADIERDEVADDEVGHPQVLLARKAFQADIDLGAHGLLGAALAGV